MSDLKSIGGNLLAKGGNLCTTCCGSTPPTPCTCPDGLASSYLLTISAGSFTDPADPFLTPITWEAQTLVATGNGTEDSMGILEDPCVWVSWDFTYTNPSGTTTGPIVLGLGTDGPDGCTDQACYWGIRFTADEISTTFYPDFSGDDPVGGYTFCDPGGSTTGTGTIGVS